MNYITLVSLRILYKNGCTVELKEKNLDVTKNQKFAIQVNRNHVTGLW